LAATFSPFDAELAFQLFIVVRRLGNRAALRVAERLGVRVPTLNRYTSIVVLHRCKQAREQICGIGRPVAVMTTVQRSLRSVDREIDIRVTTRAKHNLL